MREGYKKNKKNMSPPFSLPFFPPIYFASRLSDLWELHAALP